MSINDLLSVAVNAHGGLSWWHQLETVKARLEQRATVTPLERILVTLHIISKAIALKLVPTNALVLTDQANFPEVGYTDAITELFVWFLN